MQERYGCHVGRLVFHGKLGERLGAVVEGVGQCEVARGKAVGDVDSQFIERQRRGIDCAGIGDDRFSHQALGKVDDGRYFVSGCLVLRLSIELAQCGDVAAVVLNVLGRCVAQPVGNRRVQLHEPRVFGFVEPAFEFGIIFDRFFKGTYQGDGIKL
ncbi:hypothetical protein D3C73_974880 [compost metagenome]